MLNRRVAFFLLICLVVAACTTVPVEQAKEQAATQTLVLFSPTSVTGESIRDETIRRIDRTARTLDLAMYSFNEPTLAEALIKAKARGVAIRVILDTTQSHSATSQAAELTAAGLPVKLMRGIKGNGIMHHKVAIYDGVVVQTGSFNWTDNASCCSWENAVFIADPQVVKRYRSAFGLMWDRAEVKPLTEKETQ